MAPPVVTLRIEEITSPGHGAVSIVRVAGPGALAHVARTFARVDLVTGVPRLVRLSHAGEELDEALVCALSPDEVELHLHGNPWLVGNVLRVLGGPSTLAPRSVEERALLLVPASASESGARILLDQAAGAWRRFLHDLTTAPEPRRLVEEVWEGSRVAGFAIRAPVVVLAGAVNAGKSTLFNVLLGSERAITSPIPGTTRDVLRARARLGRYVVELVDTAGERAIGGASAAERIEAGGMQKALAVRTHADVVLWLSVGESPAPEPKGAVRLFTQVDRSPAPRAPGLSALCAPLEARETVARLVQETLRLPDEPWRRGAPRACDEITLSTLARLRSAPDEEALRGLAAHFCASSEA